MEAASRWGGSPVRRWRARVDPWRATARELQLRQELGLERCTVAREDVAGLLLTLDALRDDLEDALWRIRDLEVEG